MRRVPFALVVVLGLAVPCAALADDEDDDLVALNAKLQAAITSLPQAIGATPTSDAEAIKKIQAVLAEVKPKLEEHKDDARYPLVEGNLKNLEGEVVALDAGHKAYVLLDEIGSTHQKGLTVPDERFKALGEAVAQFGKATNARWKPVSESYAKLAVTLGKQNQDIGKRLAELEKDKQRLVAEQRRVALAEKARKSLDHLYLSLKAGEKVSEEALADLKKTADELDTIVRGAGIFYAHEHARFARIALWTKPDPEAQQAVAESLGGTLAAKGTTASKAFSASFPATPDTCYLLVARFAKASGAEKMSDFAWTSKAGRASVQSFELAEAERGEGFEKGLCATQATTITATARLDFYGSKNGLRWAVVAIERAKFPADLALRLAVDPIDHCDLAFWKTLWTSPIPGTLVWREKEPLLLLDEEGHAIDLSGEPAQLLVERISSKPPKEVVPGVLKFTGCTRHGEPAWTAESKALKACTDPIDRKFAKSRAELVKQRAKGAKTEDAQAKLDAEIAAEIEKKCGAMEAKVAKAFGELFTQLSADLAARPTPSLDRVGGLQARLGVTPK